MQINKEGLQIIKDSESCRLAAYLCAAKVETIGWGSTFYANGSRVKLGDTITQAGADALLMDSLTAYEKDVASLVTVPLNENQFSALVSLIYNIGRSNLRKSTLLRKLNEHEYAAAAEEFPRWNKAGGRILNGLTIRRGKEKNLFLKPISARYV